MYPPPPHTHAHTHTYMHTYIYCFGVCVDILSTVYPLERNYSGIFFYTKKITQKIKQENSQPFCVHNKNILYTVYPLERNYSGIIFVYKKKNYTRKTANIFL